VQRDFGWCLDRHLRMGEGSASGVPWGNGLRKGDVGELEGLPRIVYSCGTEQYMKNRCQLTIVPQPKAMPCRRAQRSTPKLRQVGYAGSSWNPSA
jgi:hypothetical protein